MPTRELLSQIERAFEEAGKKEDWLYRSYLELRDINQLAHFQIFNMNWFDGADRIIELIDELHTKMTSKEDFIYIAKLLNVTVDHHDSKENIAKEVKRDKNWRAKCFELEQLKKRENRKKQLKPLYDKLSEFGYVTELLPRQIKYKLWVLEAINPFGEIETIYLNESANGKTLVQSTNFDFIGVLSGLDHVFSERI